MIDPEAQRRHDAAEEAGELMYKDPQLPLWVMTGKGLKRRGHCCGKGCRHCPYPPKEQERAGRPGSE